MAILRFRKLTRAQFDALDVRDLNTRYTVEEPDNTLVDYIGDRPVLSGDSAINPEHIKTLYESNPDTNVFDDAAKDKLETIESGSQGNVKSDWDATTGDAEILNKPTPDQFLGVSDVGYVKRIDENTFEIDGNTYVTEGSFNLQLLEKQSNKPDGTNQLIINGKLNSVYVDSLYASDIAEVDTLEEMLLLEDMKRGDIVIVKNVETTYILKQEPSDDVDNWASFLVQPAVISVNGKVGVVQIGISDIENLQGLLNSKLNISVFEDELIILNNKLNTKVDKVSGKGLSTEDYTSAEKNKLAGIASGAEVNVQSDWTQEVNTADDYIKNKPAIPTKVSDLTNDTGYITGYTETDPIFTAWNKSTGISITKSQVSDLIEATQVLSGLMSATDKQRLDVLHALLEEDTANNVVDSINEVLAIFQNYPEGADLVTALAGKVDKVTGKGLSTEDYTSAEKTKLSGIQAGAQVNPSASAIKSQYESNANTNAFTDGEKSKLSGIEVGAEVNEVNSVNGKVGAVVITAEDIGALPDGTPLFSGDYDNLSNKPTIDQLLGNLSTLGFVKRTGTNTYVIDSSVYLTAITKLMVEAVLTGTITTHTHPNATTGASGYMSNSDKDKLDGIQAGAQVNPTGSQIKTLYESNSNTNAFTDGEKSKLASLESSKFVGQYISLAQLQAAHPTALVGAYGFVDPGSGSDVIKYIWDSNDTKWVLSGEVNQEITAAQVKTLYEDNADTNAFTDTEKSKLSGIEVGAEVNPSAAVIKSQYESNADTNAFTDDEKGKLEGIEAGAEVNEVNSVNGKQGVVVLNQDDVGDGTTYKQVSQAEKNTWNNKQDELIAGDNITIVGDTISASGVDLNTMSYYDYAGSIYGAKYNLLTSAWGHSLTVDPLEISADSSTSTPVRGTAQYPDGETEGVIIPQGTTSIGDYAFNGWDTNNQPLVIPNSVTSIAMGAFQGWNANTQPLVIPNSVMSIGDVAFAHWTENKHPLIIPDSVTSIGEHAFRNWPKVPYVEMQGETPPTIDSTAFYDQNNAPIYVPDASLDDYKTATSWAGLANRIFSIKDKLIGDATASTPDPYFDYAVSVYGTKYDLLTSAWESSLAVDLNEISADTTQGYPAGTIQYPNGATEGIIIPHGITYIGQNVFIGGSINLPLVIPGSVTSIGDGAFAQWGSNKQPLVIPNTVTSIGNGAFSDWSGNDQPLILPNSVTNIGDQAFAKWHTNNQPLTTPRGVTTIGVGAFEYWTANNQPLTISNNIVNITANAFQYWTENNQPLVIEDGVMVIGDGAFNYWPQNNQPLTIPDSVMSIGAEAFSHWVANNKPLTIGNSVTSIGDNAFYYWAANNHPLVIPDSVTSIGTGAFNIWPGNNQPLTIGNGVTSIGDNAFNSWPQNNKPLTIGNSVTSIGDNAFTGWPQNEHPLVIPASVTSIGAGAFQGWPKVPYVEMQGETPPTIFDPGVFSGQNDAPIYVPDASLDDYKTATNWMHLAYRIFSINDKVIVDVDDLDEMPYYNYAGSIYGAKYSLLTSAWEHSLTVDPSEISALSSAANTRGIAQYPNGETEGVIIPQGTTSIGNYAFYNWAWNNQPLVIPNGVMSIGNYAFEGWNSNNHPLVIPNSVMTIGVRAFHSWYANNHPLVIPEGVTSIDSTAFSSWESNNHPIVIPDSVTDIGTWAFSGWFSVPYVEMKSETPPTLASSNAFGSQNDAPIYVPEWRVDDYKAASNWADLADRIFSIKDKDKRIEDAPSDGKLYGRKDNTWEEVEVGGGITKNTINIDLDGDDIEVMYNYVGDDPLNFTVDFSNSTLGGGLTFDMGAGPMPISMFVQTLFGKTTLNYFEIILLFRFIIVYTFMGLIKTSSNDSIKDILELYADDYRETLPNVFNGINDVNINGAAFTVDFMVQGPEDGPVERFLDLTGRGSDMSVTVETTSQVIDEVLTFNGMTLKLFPNIKMSPNYDNDGSGAGGGGEVDLNEMSYFDYAGSIYGAKYSLLASAWESSLAVDPLEISENSVQATPRGTAQYPNGETEGVIIPQGVTSIGNHAFSGWSSNNQPLVIPDSVTSIGGNTFNNWSSNNQPLVIPDSVTSLGSGAFNGWSSNNQPLVIPDSVTSLGTSAFQGWTSNNQPLVIPQGVTIIDQAVFRFWSSNNHPIVIPDSITSIGYWAFNGWSLVPYVEMKRTTPPTLVDPIAFGGQNDAPIYVPDESVAAYKAATNWTTLADRIFPISDLNNSYSKDEIDNMIGDIEALLGGI